MTHRSRSNIRRAKGITPDTVRALLNLRHAGTDVAYLPLERMRLADQVKGSAPINPGDVPACMRDDCISDATLAEEPVIRGKQGFVIIDECAAFAPTAPLDPADVPACMRPDCDGSFGQPVIIGFDFASGPDQTVVAEFRGRGGGKTLTMAAVAVVREQIAAELEINGLQSLALNVQSVSFPSVPQPQPPQGCADEARSALLAPEPTAPTVDKRQRAKSQRLSDNEIARADRLDRIREAAGKLALRNRPAPRPLPGHRNQRRDLAAATDPIAQRREAIERAIRFLKSKAILVDILDRSAMIRRYRVSGKRDTMLAEEVIEYARQLGLEDQG